MWIIISGFSGWIAGQIMKGRGYGILWNIIIGILGGYMGRFILDLLNISTGNDTIGVLITSVVGAIALIFVSGIISGRKN